MQIAKWNTAEQKPRDICDRNSVKASNGVPYREMASLNRLGYHEYHAAEVPQGGRLDNAAYTLANGIITQSGDVVDAATVEAEAYADRVAAIPAHLWQAAALFRSILRDHFGENAETNTEVTQSVVTAYFVNRRLSGELVHTDTADAMILENGFNAIKEWTGDGAVWSFPWQQLAEGE